MSNSGEFKTLLNLVEKEKQIIIPIIQRDYAQGRPEEEELRNDFIKYLEDHLINSIEPTELDFIYGTLNEENNKYTILDGQQRLTTLFLLHWYLAKLDGVYDQFQQAFSQNNNKINFTYETRASSTDFCDKLITQEFSLDNLLDTNVIQIQLSESIENCNWFISSWKDDQTVTSMLVMLDTIHNNFKNHKESNLYNKLSKGSIGFKFLNLDNYHLTDDLYIKMNSTGLSLTSFENFKAHLEHYLKSLSNNEKYYLKEIEELVNLQTYFSFRLDSTWSDFFWMMNQTDGIKVKFDDMIMNLFHLIFTNTFYEYKKNTDWSEFIKPSQQQYPPLSCKRYIATEVISNDSVKDISVFLDIISSSSNNDITELFAKSVSGSPAYEHRLLFYAYFTFITYHSVYNEVSKNFEFNKDNELKEWIRIINNLVENTTYNTVKDFSRDIKAIKDLIKHSINILGYISRNEFSGFDPYPKEEEQLKARLIEAQEHWHSMIVEIEEHKYLRGQIRFLLDISDITNESSIEKWTIEQHKEYQEKLKLNYRIYTQCFNDKGLATNDYLWERSLLTQGDYLISVGSNSSFCTNIGRDTSWKRCFRDKKDVLKKLFEQIKTIDSNVELPIENILQTIIDSRTPSIEAWREQFIQCPELFNYIKGNRYIRKESDQGFCLLSKERMNSWHTELFSLTFYLQYKDTSFNQFKWDTYQWDAGDKDYNQPFAKLNLLDTGYYICVSYHNNAYLIWFGHEDDKKHPIEENYRAILIEEGFLEDEPHWYKKENIIDMESTNQAIDFLSKALFKIQN